MLERDVENYLVKRIKDMGGKAYKFSSPSNRAVPDRLCLIPGDIFLVECKAPGKEPTKLQLKIHKNMRAMGAEVLVVDTEEKVDILVNIKLEERYEASQNDKKS